MGIFHSTEDGCLHPLVVPGSIVFYLRTTPPYRCLPADYPGDGVVRNKGLNSPVTVRLTRPDVWETCSQDTGIAGRCAEHRMMWKSHPDSFQKSIIKLL